MPATVQADAQAETHRLNVRKLAREISLSSSNELQHRVIPVQARSASAP